MEEAEKLLERPQGEEGLEKALLPGVIQVSEHGGLASADPRAVELLAWQAGGDLELAWRRLEPRLAAAGMHLPGAGDSANGGAVRVQLEPAAEHGGRRLRFLLYRPPPGGTGAILLVHDMGIGEALEADLRLAALMRSLSQIAPSVAHDLRAPINAMVLNLEVLKETLAAGRAADGPARDRQARYVQVLRDELDRLYRSLENFLAHVYRRSQRTEVLDLREVVADLAAVLVAPARKQQSQVVATAPEERVPVEGDRFLLRQALLHLGVAALAGVPRNGRLELRLERGPHSARLRIGGAGESDGAAQGGGPGHPATSADRSGEWGEEGGRGETDGFGLRFSSGGTLAQLAVARAIVESQSGTARSAGRASAAEPAGPPGGFEIVLPLVQVEESR
jgi:signal transduction histidine kinase